MEKYMKKHINVFVCIAVLALAPTWQAQGTVVVSDDFEDGTHLGLVPSSSVIGGTWRAGSSSEVFDSRFWLGIPTPDDSDKYAQIFVGSSSAFLDFDSAFTTGDNLLVEYEVNTGTFSGPTRLHWLSPGDVEFNQTLVENAGDDYKYRDSAVSFAGSGIDFTNDRWIRVSIGHVLGTSNATITLNNLDQSLIVSTTVSDFNTAASFDALRFTSDSGSIYVYDNIRITLVPEPSTAMLLGVGGLMIFAGFRKRRTR